MKLRKSILILVIISSISSAGITAQPIRSQIRTNQLRPPTTTSNNTVEYDLSYDFYTSGETHRISLTVILPQTIPGRQNILSIKYSSKPARIFLKNGNRYAEFVLFEPGKRKKVRITVRAELLRYDLLTAKEKYKQYSSENLEFKDFLKQEKHIEKNNPQIQEIAESIEGQTEIDIVRNIYNFVVDNLEYTTSQKDWGAVKALQQKKGDCSEYSDLFVAICRTKNIPARVVTGYTAQTKPSLSKHHWVEVFLQNYGWVPFDPTQGDVKNGMFRDIAFGRMRPVYIYLSHVRNDEILNNYHFAWFIYWGDRVRLKDSIEFKQPAPLHQTIRRHLNNSRNGLQR